MGGLLVTRWFVGGLFVYGRWLSCYRLFNLSFLFLPFRRLRFCRRFLFSLDRFVFYLGQSEGIICFVKVTGTIFRLIWSVVFGHGSVKFSYGKLYKIKRIFRASKSYHDHQPSEAPCDTTEYLHATH